MELGGILVPRRPARVGGALVATREVVGGPAGAVREGEGGARRGGEVDEGDEAIGERALGVRADPPDAHDRHQHAHRAEHRHPVGGERQDVLERRGIDGVDEIVRPLLRLAKGAERAALHRRPHPEHPRSTPLGRRCVTADLPCRGPPQTRWRPPPRYANLAEPHSFAVEPERPVVARAETSVASVTASRAAPRRMRPRHLPARRLRVAERQISPAHRPGRASNHRRFPPAPPNQERGFVSPRRRRILRVEDRGDRIDTERAQNIQHAHGSAVRMNKSHRNERVVRVREKEPPRPAQLLSAGRTSSRELKSRTSVDPDVASGCMVTRALLTIAPRSVDELYTAPRRRASPPARPLLVITPPPPPPPILPCAPPHRPRASPPTRRRAPAPPDAQP